MSQEGPGCSSKQSGAEVVRTWHVLGCFVPGSPWWDGWNYSDTDQGGSSVRSDGATLVGRLGWCGLVAQSLRH